MPSEPKIISLYLTYLSKSSKFSTLKRRLASISVIHKLSGHYIDTKHPIITENLMGIKRVKGSHQKAKKPILINDLKLIVNIIDKDKNEKNKLKNRALILIGFAGGFRRSELVAIDYEDVEFVDEGVKIFEKRSKSSKIDSKKDTKSSKSDQELDFWIPTPGGAPSPCRAGSSMCFQHL